MSYQLRTFSFHFLAVSLLLFLSCDIFQSSGRLKPIEGNILFSVGEEYEDHSSIGEPSIMLSLVTEKIYPCCNWSILCGTVARNYEISIDFLGIYVPEVCLTAIGPARSASFLNIPSGECRLRFSYRNNEDIYNLILTDSYIKIVDDMSRFTESKFGLFWRYPSNSFAYLCGTTTETSWICEDFLDTLLSKINLEEFQFPDSGEIPYPRSSMGHYYDMPAKYFFYERDEDFDKAGEILERYTRNIIGERLGIGISLISWKNKRYDSWSFNN